MKADLHVVVPKDYLTVEEIFSLMIGHYHMMPINNLNGQRYPADLAIILDSKSNMAETLRLKISEKILPSEIIIFCLHFEEFEELDPVKKDSIVHCTPRVLVDQILSL